MSAGADIPEKSARRPAGRLPVVVIDARMVEGTPHGVARYVTHIASGLRALRRVYPLAYEPVFLVGGALELEGGAFQGFRARQAGAGYLSPRELREVPQILMEEGAALYHSPSFSSLLTRGFWRAPCPWVATVHDLNHLHYGDWRRRLYYRVVLRPFARRACVLATVSLFSRRELSGWTGIPEERIEVVRNAIDPRNASRPTEEEARHVLERLGLGRGRYFLCISNSKPHKNIGALVEAFGGLQSHPDRSGNDWPLVLSMTDFGERPGVKAVGPLNDGEARVLRAFAGAVCFPSEYEGFGLPPVEAAVAGAPLIVSRIPPHQEGLMDLDPGDVSWVAPRDIPAWREALDRARRGELTSAPTEKRERILARFSEEALARHMDRIYRRVLSEKA